MDNYIINDKTICLIKNYNKTIIIDVDNIRVINKNINKIIELNCLLYGANFNNKKDNKKLLIDVKYKIPIYLSKNICLIKLNSLRNKSSVIILLDKIINYKSINNKLIIKCVNNYNFIVKLTKNKIEKLIINALKINNYLNSEK